MFFFFFLLENERTEGTINRGERESEKLRFRVIQQTNRATSSSKRTATRNERERKRNKTLKICLWFSSRIFFCFFFLKLFKHNDKTTKRKRETSIYRQEENADI